MGERIYPTDTVKNIKMYWRYLSTYEALLCYSFAGIGVLLLPCKQPHVVADDVLCDIYASTHLS